MEHEIEDEVGRINGILGAKGMMIYAIRHGSSYTLFLEKASESRTIRSLLYQAVSPMECLLLLSNIRDIKENHFSGIARCF
jgi:hypothetical protein